MPPLIMASAANDRDRGVPVAHLSSFLHSASTKLYSFLNPKSSPPSNPSRISHTSSSSAVEGVNFLEPVSESRSTVRVSTGKGGGGGPAFLGQVFSMYKLSGAGLMDLSTQVDIPFLSKRTPEWLKEMFAAVNKSKRKCPAFRFFTEMDDVVSYVELLNTPNSVVGACNLDTAYEHFKVKEANKLKIVPYSDGRKKVDGVPIFSSQNLDSALETTDGIKRYTPYFFDKTILDGILEECVDQHFQSLIEIRDLHQRAAVYGDDVDDNLEDKDVEEMGESFWEPPEVQEVQDELLNEMGHPVSPLSLISNAAMTRILHAVDKVVLGNRWLRKVIGIQPKFQYMVYSFEKKSAASFHRAKTPFYSECGEDAQLQRLGTSNAERKDNARIKQAQIPDFWFAFGDWLTHPWLKQQQKQQSLSDARNATCSGQHRREALERSLFHPKITVIISKEEPGTSEASLEKKIDDIVEELERVEQENRYGSSRTRSMVDERDPLFVAGIERLSFWCVIGSAQWA